MGPNNQKSVSPLMAGLLDHRVSAQVTALDHYRVGGGVAVETDYIISVKCIDNGKKTRPEPDFDPFTISKTYSAFRTLADQLHDLAENALRDVKGENMAKLPLIVQQVAKYCQMVDHLVDSQRTHYLGKVNYTFVRLLSKQRKQIINDVLDTTLVHFPSDIECHPLLSAVGEALEAFFLTDHCQEVEDDSDRDLITNYLTPKKNYAIVETRTDVSTSSRSVGKEEAKAEKESTAKKGIKRTVTSPVVPHTRKTRKSVSARHLEETELEAKGSDANLLLDDDRPSTELVPSYSSPQPTVSSSVGSSALGTLIDNNPIAFLVIFIAAMYILRRAEPVVMTVDLDVALLIGFASFCLGLHCPRPLVGGIDSAPLQASKRRGGRKPLSRMRTKSRGVGGSATQLLRKSFLSISPKAASGEALMEVVMQDMEPGEAGEEQAFDWIVKSPMDRFPDGAELGTHFNCWSDSPASGFKVRSDKYLSNGRKVPSGDFLLPTRGVDLFLTDACPENVGRISGVLGGELRDKPTFIINFRLPWGVLIGYYEIPERFIPFVKACYEPSVDKKVLEATLKKMSNPDRCCARYFMGNNAHKNSALKIVPGIADGPWVVKSVVGGKPAVIGNKLPVNYFYEPEKEVEGENGKKVKQALYLEADLDIVSSSAARGILSVVRQYTQDLTVDLGFVVQGNTADELPEQMLLGTRLHGIDPMNAPPLPPMKDMLYLTEVNPADDESVSNIGS